MTDAQIRAAIEQWRPLLSRWARMYERPGIDATELYAAGVFGLWRAYVEHDPSRGSALPGMVYRHIRWAMLRCRDEGDPRTLHVQGGMRRVNRVRDSWRARCGEEPTVEQIAASLRESVDQVERWISAHRAGITVSLDAPISEDEGDSMTLHDVLTADDEFREAPGWRVVDRLSAEGEWDRLYSLARDLPESWRLVLDLRFRRGLTLRECAAELGRSYQSVLNVQREALSRMRREAVSRGWIGAEV